MNYAFGVCPLCKQVSVLYYEVCFLCYTKLEKQKFNYTTPYFCPTCLEPLLHEDAQCLHPVTDRPLVRVVPYAHEAKQLILQYKKNSIRRLSYTICNLIQPNLQRIATRYGKFLCIPVPCSKQRLVRFGWDQVKTILTVSRYPFLELIKRTESQPQKSLNREQRLRMATLAYTIDKQIIKDCECIIQHYDALVVFDDVVTTGATMRVCMELLETLREMPIIGFCVAVD